MWDKESLHQQPVLNEYPQHFIFQQNKCKAFLEVSKRNDFTSTKVKCYNPSFVSDVKKSPTTNILNGHQMKDYQKTSNHDKPINGCGCLKPPDLIRNTNEASFFCNCPKDIKAKIRNKHLNGIIGKSKKQNISLLKCTLKNGHPDHNHRKKQIVLKQDEHEQSNEEKKEIVLKSMQRLQFRNNWRGPSIPINKGLTTKLLAAPDQHIEIELYEKQCTSTRRSKNTRSLSANSSFEKRYDSSKSSKSSISSRQFKCEWHDCLDSFEDAELLTTHVIERHVNSDAKKNDDFVCLWRDCKFSNQNCSFKWLSKHVIRHCNLKPFKCVILGCDMTFSTQNGLARHVPTHFNESRVRRACVITSEAAKREEADKPRRSLNTSLDSCSSSGIVGNDQTFNVNKKRTDDFILQNSNLL